MEEKILLYDSNNVKIGDTYVRRARQLVKQQRASWTDDSQRAIRFAPGAEYSDLPGGEPFADAPLMDKALMTLAKRRVVLAAVFKGLCLVYLAVNVFLIGIWFFTGSGYFWPGWVLAGWGLGLMIVRIIFWSVTSSGTDFKSKVAREYERLGGGSLK